MVVNGFVTQYVPGSANSSTVIQLPGQGNHLLGRFLDAGIPDSRVSGDVPANGPGAKGAAGREVPDDRPP
jgi:hypothetical protein